jgi:hypothetical protein
MSLGAAAGYIALIGLVAMLGGPAQDGFGQSRSSFARCML